MIYVSKRTKQGISAVAYDTDSTAEAIKLHRYAGFLDDVEVSRTRPEHCTEFAEPKLSVARSEQ